MKTLNIEDLPEHVARALENMVRALCDQFGKNQEKDKDKKKEKRELPVWPGTVIGRLSREEIYDDVV